MLGECFIVLHKILEAGNKAPTWDHSKISAPIISNRISITVKSKNLHKTNTKSKTVFLIKVKNSQNKF